MFKHTLIVRQNNLKILSKEDGINIDLWKWEKQAELIYLECLIFFFQILNFWAFLQNNRILLLNIVGEFYRKKSRIWISVNVQNFQKNTSLCSCFEFWEFLVSPKKLKTSSYLRMCVEAEQSRTTKDKCCKFFSKNGLQLTSYQLYTSVSCFTDSTNYLQKLLLKW